MNVCVNLDMNGLDQNAKVQGEELQKERENSSNCHVLTIADINECIQEPCGDQAACSNNVGSYICVCDIIGYGWNGTACAGKAFVS